MKLSNYEKETIINFNEAEKTASVYTHNAALQEQLAALFGSHPDKVRRTADNGHGGLTYEFPKKWLKIKPPRALSPAQRRVLEDMNRKKQKPPISASPQDRQ